MRAIVTGGAGFIGSHLVDRLVTDGWRVLVVDDGSNPSSGYRNPAAVYIEASVQQALVADDPVQAVFHLASKVGPTGVLRWAGSIAKDTIDAAGAAAGWALRAGCPLIDVSTSEVYGGGDRIAEDQVRRFEPGSSARMEYAVAKLAAESMLLNTPGLDVRIIRPFNVTGPRQMPDGGFVLPRFVHQALAGEPLTVYQPGTQRRAFTHVFDIVEGIVAAFERGKAGEAYNLGNDVNECTVWELAAEVDEAVNGFKFAPNLTVVDPATLHGPAFREAPEKLPDASKATRELGWHPRWFRDEVIEDAVAYWRAQ